MSHPAVGEMEQDRSVDVVALQIAATLGDIGGNVTRLAAAVRQHGADADLVIAPELATTGYDLELVRTRGREIAEPVDGPSVRSLVDAAVDADVTLVAGFLELAGGVVYDSVVTVTPDGITTPYRKTHLYPPELDCFAAGTELRAVKTPIGTLGPLICFEHAFPDIATTLALEGAQILVIPSAVPIGFEHLLALRTRARGQDNQVFVIACNLTGNGFCGHSLITDPRGDVVAAAGDNETVLRARLDLDAVRREREREPALRLRRPELYRCD